GGRTARAAASPRRSATPGERTGSQPRQRRQRARWSRRAVSSDASSPASSAHQVDAPPRAIGFVAGGEERGARLEAKPAVDARVERLESAALSHLSQGGQSEPSTATTNASPGSNVRRRPATSGPTPSR